MYAKGGQIVTLCRQSAFIWLDVITTAGERIGVNIAQSERTPDVHVGDFIWWEAHIAFWTPNNNASQEKLRSTKGKDWDVPLAIVGMGVASPAETMINQAFPASV